MATLSKLPHLPLSSAKPHHHLSLLLLPHPHLRRLRRTLPPITCKIHEIFMPALSSTMTEGKIVSWIKSEGDRLSKGEGVVVVESDKADMEVESFYDGILAAIVVPEGCSAPVGSPIALLAGSEADLDKAREKAKTIEVASPKAEENSAKIEAATEIVTAPIQQSNDTVVVERKSSGVVIATPYAKKLAKQHKVDIGSVVGTGPYGRVTPGDVEKAAGIVTVSSPKKSTNVVVDGVVAAVSPAAGSVKASGGGFVEIAGGSVVPFTTMQAAVAKNMVESLSVPVFRVGYPVVTDALDHLYEKVKPKGVTMTALLAKAVAMALVQHPVVNSTCKDGKSFTYNSSINIAVAVAINGGLITPVLQDADKLDLYLLSQKWKGLVEKARTKQLQPHEYSSGTFTLSNLGMFGVDRFDAILPFGQGAIMAVGASKPTVVADADGFFSVKNKMLVNVTADHRIIYGADLAAFLQTFSKIIQDPESLTM
ncbi:hypothetical protein Droror1_Dr00018998 [Drosera rotundifolia]